MKKTEETIKAINLQHVYINRRKATFFEVWELIGNAWVYQTRTHVEGWLKTGKGCLRKKKRQIYE